MSYPRPKVLGLPKKKKIIKPKLSINDSQNPLLKLIKEYLINNCGDSLEIKLDHLPPSANELYEKSIRKNHKTGKHFLGVNTHFNVDVFRSHFTKAVRTMKVGEIPPKEIITVVIELYSENWLNQDKTPKKRDSDNMIKSLMDSLEIATRYPDEMAFVHNVFKLHGKEQTIITLYSQKNEIFTH